MTSHKRNKDRKRRKRRQSRRNSANKAADSATILPKTMTKQLICKVAKVDASLGLVFGWAIICTKSGQPYVDLGNDNIPDDSMLKAATKYAKGSRTGGDMHRVEDGTVRFMFPLTAEIAKAFGISTDQTGLMIAMEPDSPETLAMFKSGERTGFSIGGHRITDTPREVAQ